jgi:hypothetical protein
MANMKMGAAVIFPDFLSADNTISKLQATSLVCRQHNQKLQATLLALVSGIQQTFSQLEEVAKQLFSNVVSNLEGSFDILGQ